MLGGGRWWVVEVWSADTVHSVLLVPGVSEAYRAPPEAPLREVVLASFGDPTWLFNALR